MFTTQSYTRAGLDPKYVCGISERFIEVMGFFEMTDELVLGDIFAHEHHGMYMNSHFGCLNTQPHSISTAVLIVTLWTLK